MGFEDIIAALANYTDLITFVTCAAILVYAAWSCVVLWLQTREVETQLWDAAGGTKSPERFSILTEPWKHYRRTFLSLSGDREKTDAQASRFFSLYSVAGQRLNLRYWGSVPSILVGMGILGTFIGLVVGVGNFDTTSVEGVNASIEQLLGGMSTAFLSSVFGMACSIAFNFFEKRRFKRLDRGLRSLCGALDTSYLLTSAERHRFEREDQLELLRRVFGHHNEEGAIIHPGDVLRDLRRESEEQTRALKSFSSDLADGIQISTQTIEALGSRIGSSFEEGVREGLGPIMEGVKEAVEQLQRERESGNEEMVQNVVAQLASTLERMGAEFQDALSGGAIEQMEKVATTVAATAETLENLPEDLDRMMQELRADFLETSRHTNQQAEETSERMRDLATTTIEMLKEQSRALVSSLAAEIRELQDRSERLIRLQTQSTESATESISQMRKVLVESKDLTERVVGTISSFNAVLGRFKSISDSLNKSTEELQSAGETLLSSSTILKKESEEARLDHQTYIKSMRAGIEEVRALTTSASDQFETIKEGLSGIFSELEAGLSNYQVQTRDGLNKYLDLFASQLSTAAGALSSSITDLHESFERMEDLFASLHSHRNGDASGNGESRP